MTRWETFVSTLNIFKPPPSTNEEDQQEQFRLSKLSSSMFYILLCVLLLCLGFLTLINEQTQIISVEHPTIQQFQELPEDAQCPCSRNILSYGDFVEMGATFHQVCSSDFVTERWLRALFYGQNSTAFRSMDFRTVAHGAFESLRALCDLAKSIIERSISSFYRTQLFNKDTMKEETLMKQTLTLIEQFQWNSLSRFQTQLSLLNTLILSDRLISSLPLNFLPIYLIISTNSFLVYGMAMGLFQNGVYCDCRSSFECISLSSIYEKLENEIIFHNVPLNMMMDISGFGSSCLPMNALLVSSLDCFFNGSCLNMLVSYLNTQESFQPLNSTWKSRFNQNSKIRSIAEQLFVEEWSHKILFSQYFSRCAPQACSYSISRRFDFGLTMVKLIGLLSGLTVVLRLIVPKAVVQFSKCFYRRPPVSVNSNQPMGLKRKICNAIQELNLFNDDTDDERQTIYQRIATRFYVVAVIIIVLSITIHTALQIKTYKVTKLNPTLSSYIELNSLHSETLVCPCTTIAVDYARFISIEPEFHQVCSSDLVSDSWLKYNAPSRAEYYNPEDYQYQALAPFTFLAMMCEQTRRTINDSLSIYLRKQYVSSSIVSKNIFESQIETSADEWKSNMISQFLLYVELYQKLVSANFLSNGDFNVDYLTDMQAKTTQMIPKTIGNCTCSLSSVCLRETPIYEYPSNGDETIIFTIPQFYKGCFQIQSFLLSTLMCFYDLSCMLTIDRYKKTGGLGNSFNFSALNPQRSSPEETVEYIVNRMMVHSWSRDISYPAYYNACKPISCSYEYTRQSNLLTIITTLLGMFGGVSLALKLFLIITLKLIKQVSQGVTRQNVIRIVAKLCQCPSEAEKITRLYIVSGIVTLVIVYSLTAFKPQKTTFTISRPTFSAYKDLISRHSNTVECACMKTSFEYKAFFSMNAILHQVCSSDFVGTSWIDYLYENGNLSLRYTHVDFRYSGYAQFQLLSDFCQIANKTLAKSIQQLRNDDLTNIHILSESSLREQINMKIDEFDEKLRDAFLNILTLLRLTIGSNKLMSVLSTNWVYETPADIIHLRTIRRLALEYDNCSCGHSSKCVQSSKGMLSGCYPLETILQTRFICLFDQQCIDSTGTFKALNVTLTGQSRYRINDTIEEVLNKLMVERYQVDISFENYFNACAPNTCSYSYIDRNNVIDGLTNIVSLYGGLMIICHVFANLVIKIIFFRPITE